MLAVDPHGAAERAALKRLLGNADLFGRLSELIEIGGEDAEAAFRTVHKPEKEAAARDLGGKRGIIGRRKKGLGQMCVQPDHQHGAAVVGLDRLARLAPFRQLLKITAGDIARAPVGVLRDVIGKLHTEGLASVCLSF